MQVQPHIVLLKFKSNFESQIVNSIPTRLIWDFLKRNILSDIKSEHYRKLDGYSNTGYFAKGLDHTEKN